MKTSALLLSALLLTLAGSAAAQSETDKATARGLYKEGSELLQAKDCAGAADKFERAEQLYHAPTILVGLGRAYVCLGKFVLAIEQYNKVIRENLPADASDSFKEAVENARREIVGLDAKIGYVVIAVTGATAPAVTIDGEPVPPAALGVKRPVDPGAHVVRATADGYKPAEASFTIAAGQQQELPLALEVDPDAPSPGAKNNLGDTLRIVGFVGIGVGAAGLIVGGITGGLAIGKHGDLSDNCPEGRCAPDQQDNLDAFNTFGTVSTITFIAGGVLAAAGLVLVLVAPSDAPTAEKATLTLGPTSVLATISF